MQKHASKNFYPSQLEMSGVCDKCRHMSTVTVDASLLDGDSSTTVQRQFLNMTPELNIYIILCYMG